MTNCGGVTGTISAVNGEYTIQSDYHDGSGKISNDNTVQTKLIPTIIRSEVTILVVAGSMNGSENVKATLHILLDIQLLNTV